MAKLITHINLDQNPTSTCASSMRSYMSHLTPMGIQHFGYYQVDQAAERLLLTTHPEFSLYFVQQKFYEIGFCEAYDHYETGYYLLSSLEDTLAARTIGVAAREKINMDYHLVMVKRHPQHSEWFIFATDATVTTQAQAYAAYLQHMPHLERFIVYFKQSAFKMLREADNHRCLYPGTVATTTTFATPPSTESMGVVPPVYLKSKDGRDAKVTRREYECLRGIGQGFTAKEIARQLGISHRTVQTHLNQLKIKLEGSSCRDLLTVMKRNQALGLLAHDIDGL